MEGVAAEQETQHRGEQDADQDRALHLQAVQRNDHEEADDGHDRRRLVQIADGDQGGRAGRDDAGVLQRDDRQEQSDARRDRAPDRMRNALDDHLPDAEQRDQQEQAAGDEHRTERRFPRQTHALDHRIGEVGVEAHARRHCDRIIRKEPHDQRADGCGHAGGDEHRVLRHAGIAKNARIDEDDVRHGQERGHAGQHFGAHIGVVLGQAEQALGEAGGGRAGLKGGRGIAARPLGGVR
ncbi:hypothetical protein D3C72_983970 [compost metagenome]